MRAMRISKVYGSTVALWQADLEARSGEAVTVEGPNACGKSTLLRILAGLLSPTDGELRWVTEAGSDAPRLAYVGHATHLYDAMTPLEHLALSAALKGAPAGEGHAAMGRLGVAWAADRRCGTLSAGTRRRIALVRALSADPDVLIVDEPLASLDADGRARVAAELERCRAAGKLVITAMPEGSGAQVLAARVVTLRDGQVVLPTSGASVARA